MNTEQTKFEPGDTVRFKGGTDEWKVMNVYCWKISISNKETDVVALDHKLELVRKAPKMVKKSGWVNVYPERRLNNFAYDNKETADSCSAWDRVACVYIEWEEPV